MLQKRIMGKTDLDWEFKEGYAEKWCLSRNMSGGIHIYAKTDFHKIRVGTISPVPWHLYPKTSFLEKRKPKYAIKKASSWKFLGRRVGSHSSLGIPHYPAEWNYHHSSHLNLRWNNEFTLSIKSVSILFLIQQNKFIKLDVFTQETLLGTLILKRNNAFIYLTGLQDSISLHRAKCRGKFWRAWSIQLSVQPKS